MLHRSNRAEEVRSRLKSLHKHFAGIIIMVMYCFLLQAGIPCGHGRITNSQCPPDVDVQHDDGCVDVQALRQGKCSAWQFHLRWCLLHVARATSTSRDMSRQNAAGKRSSRQPNNTHELQETEAPTCDHRVSAVAISRIPVLSPQQHPRRPTHRFQHSDWCTGDNTSISGIQTATMWHNVYETALSCTQG